MKRALAIAVAVCTLGVAGFGIAPITGEWKATVGLLPAPITLTSDLTLNYTVAGFTVTSVSVFDAAGLDSQRFDLRGAFGPFTLTGRMMFEVSPPAYRWSDITGAFDFGGIAITGAVRHWMGGFGPWGTGARWGPDVDPCPGQTPPAMQYILSTTVAPLTVRTRFLDCSTGIEFQDLLVTLTDLPLCCGITFDASLSFTKAGFGSLGISGFGIPLVAGVSFDVAITYTVTAKSVTLTPRIADTVACFSVWVTTLPVPAVTGIWEGIRVDGFSIRCALTDCNYIEYVHIFRRPGIPAAVLAKLSEPIGENEYLELGFCGPGCCGARWDVTLRTLWTTAPAAGVTPGIFGTTRFVGAVNIPIMTNFISHLTFSMPSATATTVIADLAPTFTFGWTFTF